MSNKKLKQKAVSGVMWTSLQRFSTMLIHFISGIILARLLTPYDYGCIGMITIFMVVAESFIDGGFGSALIQKKKPTQQDYSTIFFWNIGVACLLYAILYASAPAIARFYRIPQLCSVLRVQGIVLLVFAFNIVQRNQLRKNLKFKILSIVTLATSLISLIVAIIMAYHGYGVWSLVALNILTAAIPAIVFWFYVRWRPDWTFSLVSFKGLFDFGLYIFLAHLLNKLSGQIQGLLIGRFYSPVTMGYYSKASKTEGFASNTISSILNQVVYPIYAEIQDDKLALGRMIKKMTMTLSYVTFPLLFILLLSARPVFILLYSERWLESVPYFQVLCIAGLALCLQSVNVMSISAIGKSKTMFIWTVIKRIFGISFIVIGLFLYGMYGLLIGIVLNQWFSYFINIYLVSRHIGYKWWLQLLDILPIGIMAFVAGIISYFVGILCHFSLYGDAILKSLVYLFVYLGLSLVVKPRAYKYTMEIITQLFSFMGAKKLDKYFLVL